MNDTPPPLDPKVMREYKQLGLFLKDEGIENSYEHANRITPGWGDQALIWLLRYIKQCKGPTFMVEDVRYWAAHRVPLPPDNRAWGGVAIRARDLGFIKHERWTAVKNPKAHATQGSVWRIIR